MRLDELIAEAGRRHPDRPAVTDDRCTLTHAALQARVAAAAAILHDAGVRRGVRVAALARNRAELLVTALAASALGAAFVPLNTRLKPAEAGPLLRDADASILVAEPDLLAAVEAALPDTLLRLTLAPLAAVAPVAPAAFDTLAALDGCPRSAPIAPDVTDADDVVQMYTSGTTGVPKGALLSHGNLASFIEVWREETDLRGGADRVHVGTPLFHVGGLVMSLTALAAGAHVSLHAEFDPQRALDALERQRITHALFVPAMLRWMLLDPAVTTRSFPELRLIVYGAAPIPPAQLAEAMSVFRCGFLQGYGLTETTGAITVLRPADHVLPDGSAPHAGGMLPDRSALHAGGVLPDASAPRADGATPGARAAAAQGASRLASAGRALRCCQLRVVDGDGGPVPPGGVGEVEVRGSNITRGYWRRPEADAETFRDGWFRTGDLATQDADGYLVLVDRRKELILVGGENVYPRQAEEALLAHPAVAEAAVLGIPHAVWGEEVLALVTLRAGATVGDRELIAHCRTRLADFRCPSRVEFRGTLPRNAAGKLDKRALREPYWAGRERPL
ncbi:MAG TPA: AMP-binding protein [Planctomycetota bacterium]|nr:AMP-binding protein [Planctomycetota bacterium]